MKKGLGMVLVLLLTVVWVSGCDFVGENEPESTQGIEDVYSNLKELPPAPENLLEDFTDPPPYIITQGDTSGQGGG